MKFDDSHTPVMPSRSDDTLSPRAISKSPRDSIA